MFLYLLSWVSMFIHLVFCTLSLAAGLYYIAEVVEEYTVLTQKAIRYMIYGTSMVYIGLMLFENMPFYMTAIGLATNLDYYILLVDFPFISLTSPSAIIGGIMVIVNHYIAFQYFATVYYPFPEVLAYFTVLLWLVPFAFFVSLSINEYTLPTMKTTQPSMGNMGTPVDNVFRRPKRAGILGMFDYLAEKKDYIKNELLGRNKMF